jgi:hypothetical protein
MRITPEEVLKHKYFVKKWNFGNAKNGPKQDLLKKQ